LGLEPPGFPGVVRPGDFEILHVPAVDLPQARISNLLGAAPVRRPAAILGRGEESEKKEDHENAMRVSKNSRGGVSNRVEFLDLGAEGRGR